VFQGDKIRHYASLRFAGSHVTNDIVQGLGVTQGDAERLKERAGVAYSPLVDPDEMIDLPSTPGQGARQAKRELLAHIIHQRIDEILGLVQQDLEQAGFTGRLPAGAVLTGGGAHLAGIVELTREVLAMPVRQGIPGRHISGLVDSVQAPRYAVPVGLALWGGRERHGGRLEHAIGDRWLGPVKRWLQDFF
jgi:cell division protein FtsA